MFGETFRVSLVVKRSFLCHLLEKYEYITSSVRGHIYRPKQQTVHNTVTYF